MLSAILQGIIDFIHAVGMFIISGLPDTPFQFQSTSWPEWVQVVGLVIPVAGMLAHFTAFVAAVAVYYAIRWLARIVKAIQ